ncbi:synergin gamma-like [Bolinopsis microptera]|uniref:synergin gamma-like n=1 Tax=Bolinopsis microptera TaxID=2820187 RepID=UPI003078D9A1
MNSQNFHQSYNPQSSSGPTAEQLAAFQKQQQTFLQQQQQYMMQQQQLQKQMMREEQRNRLKNMNSSTSTNVSFSGSSNLQGMFQSDTSLALTPSASPRMEGNDSYTETVSSFSKPIFATENHVPSIQSSSSFSTSENNQDDFDEFDDFQTAVPESTPADPAEMKVGIKELLGITTPKPEPKKESNSILNMFGSNNLASVSQGKKSEPTEQDWTDFTTTPVAVVDHSLNSSVPAIDLAPPVKTNPSNLNMTKIPSIYKDIIAFCNTPSGIIDVGKIYEILLTDKFKVVALQPLMSQCKMMGSPTAKDLVDLLGIVALKQKGFPTPSKYELNYQKLSIPSINMSVLKKNKSNQKESKSEQPTLLSFVSQDAEKKVPALAPVFDFGMSSTKDLSCAPFAGPQTNNNGMLPTDLSANNDDDDWGDFGEVSEPAKSTNFSWDNNQVADFAPSTKSSPVVDLLNMPIVVSTKSNPVVDLLNMPGLPVRTSSLTVSLPKPRSAAPLKLDEPPPLSDEDDEDWADFAHPAHKWDIDPDDIEEQAVNNTASKNRWGTISISSDKGTGIDNYHDKDYSHVKVEDVEDTKAEQPNFFAANLSSISVAKMDVAMSDVRSKFDVPSPATTNNSNKDKLVFEKEVVFADETTTKKNVVQKDLDKLASPDADLGQFVSPFADLTDSNPQPFDAVFMKSVEKKKFDNVFVISAGAFDSGNNKDESAASNFDSPFADFNNNTAKAITESGDFGNFTTSGDAETGEKDSQEPESFVPAFADFGSPSDDEDEFADFCGTAEDNDSTKDTLTESLKLTNLPKKDLDGFWNDMVDGLGSKTDSVPVFDLNEEAPKKVSKPVDVTAFVPTVQHPVSYDALKGESFDNEEDRIGAWSKSLSMILTILIHCQSLLGASKVPLVKQEVVDSEKGKLYLDCCTEVFRVACRISLAGAFDDGIVEIFKEIKHTWTLISEMLDDSIDLPTIRDFNIRPAKTEDEFSGRNCGICLLDTGVESKTSKLQYNGVFYHVTCANFWVNSVSPLLPDLNSKLEAPLL